VKKLKFNISIFSEKIENLSVYLFLNKVNIESIHLRVKAMTSLSMMEFMENFVENPIYALLSLLFEAKNSLIELKSGDTTQNTLSIVKKAILQGGNIMENKGTNNMAQQPHFDKKFIDMMNMLLGVLSLFEAKKPHEEVADRLDEIIIQLRDACMPENQVNSVTGQATEQAIFLTAIWQATEQTTMQAPKINTQPAEPNTPLTEPDTPLVQPNANGTLDATDTPPGEPEQAAKTEQDSNWTVVTNKRATVPKKATVPKTDIVYFATIDKEEDARDGQKQVHNTMKNYFDEFFIIDVTDCWNKSKYKFQFTIPVPINEVQNVEPVIDYTSNKWEGMYRVKHKGNGKCLTFSPFVKNPNAY
jgi:hypothetical protein